MWGVCRYLLSPPSDSHNIQIFYERQDGCRLNYLLESVSISVFQTVLKRFAVNHFTSLLLNPLNSHAHILRSGPSIFLIMGNIDTKYMQFRNTILIISLMVCSLTCSEGLHASVMMTSMLLVNWLLVTMGRSQLTCQTKKSHLATHIMLVMESCVDLCDKRPNTEIICIE